MIRAAAACLLSIVVGLAAFAPPASAVRLNPAVQLTACHARPRATAAPSALMTMASPTARHCWSPRRTAAGSGRSRRSRRQAPHSLRSRRPTAVAWSTSRAPPRVTVSLWAAIRAATTPTMRCCSPRRTAGGRAGSGRSCRPTRRGRPAPKSGIVDDLGLAAVSCSSVGNCVAVGNYETDAEVWEGLILTETHGHWSSATEAPLPAGAPVAGQDAVLLAVTCRVRRSLHGRRQICGRRRAPAGAADQRKRWQLDRGAGPGAAERRERRSEHHPVLARMRRCR